VSKEVFRLSQYVTTIQSVLHKRLRLFLYRIQLEAPIVPKKSRIWNVVLTEIDENY
jgi:hypothetical protein